MSGLTIYRKRLIPAENVLLKDDVIVYRDDHLIITKWKALKERRDSLTHGLSCYYPGENYKVSEFYSDTALIHSYIDIVEYEWANDKNAMTTTDLLADIAVLPDGSVRVLDLDELADAYEERIITQRQLLLCLRTVDTLLRMIRAEGVGPLTAPLAPFRDQ